MTKDFTYDVFLSHNSKDKERVRRLAQRLQQAGLRVWFDEWVLKPGDDIYLAIEHGLEASRTLILCMSPNAFGSDWVSLERSTVMFRYPTNKNRGFIPLLLDDCDIPDTLKRLIYVDFREESEDAFKKLLSSCKPEQSKRPAIVRPVIEKKSWRKSQTEVILAKEEEPKEKPQTKKIDKKKITPSPKSLNKRKQELQEIAKQIEPLAVLEYKRTGHNGWVWSVAVSPDWKWIASASFDKTIRIWDLATGECRAVLKGHTDWVLSVAITSDGKKIISGSADKSVRIWDALSGRQIAQFNKHRSKVTSIVALQDNIHALSGACDNMLRFWDIASCSGIKIIKYGEEPANNIHSIAINLAKMHVLSGHRDGRIRYWSFETDRYLAILKGHSGIVNSIQITPDGRFSVSGSNDGTIKIWDLETYLCIGTLEGHQEKIHSVAISPDSTLIASTGFTDGTVRLWDWKSGACLQVIKNEDDASPVSVTFTPDGSRLVVGTAGPPHNIYIYQLTNIQISPSPQATQRYTNAKVVLLGEGTVGKTSLAHRLIEDKYVIKDRTHGMNVWPLDLPPPNIKSGIKPDSKQAVDHLAYDNLDREALLWDLAGQEDYT